MKSEAFFQLDSLRAAQPICETGRHHSRSSSLLLIFVSLTVLVAGGIAWSRQQSPLSHLSLATDGEQSEQQPFLREDRRKPVFDLNVTRDSESMYFRSIAGELYHLDYSTEGRQLLAPLFPNRYCVKFVISPDQNQIVAGFLDGSVILCPLDRPADQRFLRDETSEIFELLTYSPDGKLLACATRGGRVSVMDVESGRVVASILKKNERVTSIVFDSERGLLISCETGLERWIIDPQEPSTDQSVCDWRIDGHYPVREMVVTSDGQYLISSSYYGVFSVTDLRRRELMWEQRAKVLAVRGLTLSPDFRSFYCYSTEKSLIQYDLRTGEELSRFQDPDMDPGSGASYSEQEDLIYTTSSDGFIRIWSTRDNLMFGRIDTADLL